jgi:glycosyltransferase involved in cell wall biosynthesis
MTDIKVCLLAPEFLPNWGGVGTYCIELAKALADKVELQIVTVERTKNHVPIYSKKEMEHFYGNSVKVHTIATCSETDTFLYNAKLQMAILQKLPSIIRDNKIDFIHTNFPHMPDLLQKLLKGLGVPSLTTIHTTIEGQQKGTLASGLSFNEMGRSEKSTLLLYPLLRALENMYLRKSRNLMTVSYWMKNQIINMYPFVSDMHVIHNGVDIKKFSRDRASTCQLLDKDALGPIVLFSSRLITAKGFHYLIQAIPRILKDHRDAHFVFTGAGPTNLWVSLLNKFEVRKASYTFLGYVDYDELPGIYAKSDIFVVPSLYENLPIRILEAMSCESSVIASEICAIPEAITHLKNGLLVSPGHVQELSESISTLLSDMALRKKLGKNARKTVTKEFDWSIIVNKTLKVYDKILANAS